MGAFSKPLTFVVKGFISVESDLWANRKIVQYEDLVEFLKPVTQHYIHDAVSQAFIVVAACWYTLFDLKKYIYIWLFWFFFSCIFLVCCRLDVFFVSLTK